ncbi:hypothetical protein FGIG_10849 [Fasciola gigantica]|uniref:Uncharacterized protein n=1 Tax=Fasciola gigantica TaxID=46835 RepID=A0A504YGZ9_FASGI|nr:hypothetical protein FGIG_10849 [Fasciola gigantica]
MVSGVFPGGRAEAAVRNLSLNIRVMLFDGSLSQLHVSLHGVEKETIEVKAHNFQVKVEGKGVGDTFTKLLNP